MKRIVVLQVIPGILMLLFFYTGFSKLVDHRHFSAELSHSPFLGNVASLVAWGVPVTELFIAGFLFNPGTRIKGLFLSLFILIVFTGYLLAMISSGLELPCSCGGVISSMSWKFHVLFNLLFLMLTSTAIIMYPPYMKSKT
ncbi:MAG: hypothetical protein QM802_02470 [Agriterribacter sp.]